MEEQKHQKRHLSIRIQDDMLKKFREVCACNRRSINGQILCYIQQAIGEYEKKSSQRKS